MRLWNCDRVLLGAVFVAMVTVLYGFGGGPAKGEKIETSGATPPTEITEGLVDGSVFYIHLGEDGFNNDVIITMSQDSDNIAIWRTPRGAQMTAAQVQQFSDEGLYVNLHTGNLPAGDIAGQL